MPSRPGGYRFIGHEFLYMVTDDWREFFATLTQEFPAIRLVNLDTARYIDALECKKVLQELQRQGLAPIFDRSARGPLPEPVPVGDMVNWQLRYIDSTWHDPTIWQIHAWIEPPGWQPRWAIDPYTAWPTLLNGSDDSITIRRASFNRGRPDSGYESADPEKLACRVSLDESRVYGGYYPHQTEKRRWLSQIRRLIMKQTTNVLTFADLETLEVRARLYKGGSDRAGRHAIDWVRAHPRHIFGRVMKAIDWELPPPPWDPGRG